MQVSGDRLKCSNSAVAKEAVVSSLPPHQHQTAAEAAEEAEAAQNYDRLQQALPPRRHKACRSVPLRAGELDSGTAQQQDDQQDMPWILEEGVLSSSQSSSVGVKIERGGPVCRRAPPSATHPDCPSPPPPPLNVCRGFPAARGAAGRRVWC